jgi:methyl-CpG-binding domain protein 4
MISTTISDRPISPLNMLQEQQIGRPHAPWRVLVVCILLNMTHGRQVRPMIDRFFDHCTGPEDCATALESESYRSLNIVPLLRPLGFVNRRVDYLQRMSSHYALNERTGGEHFWASWPDGEWARPMAGVGQYAVDSLNIFVYGRLERVSSDTWLNDYIEWAKCSMAVDEFRRKHPELIKFWREHV